MSRITLNAIVAAALIFSLSTSVAADLVIKSRVTGNFSLRLPPDLNSNTYETTTYFKGARQRDDILGTGSIYQCDIKQLIWFNSLLKIYSVDSPATMTPEERAAREIFYKQWDEKILRDKLRDERAQARRRGGVITGTEIITDTGERREMFGYTARHIITKSFAEASPTACDQYPIEMETDGWYIDLLYGFNCSPDLSGAMGVPGEISSAAGKGPYFSMPVGYLNLRRKPRKGCSGSSYDDVLQYKRIGTARFGYPVLLTVKHRQKDTRTSIATHEVTNITNTELDQSLFEVPASFTRIIPKYGVAK